MTADVFVVLRAAGERTEAAARALAAADLGHDAVATVREVPFAAALRRGLEIGAEAGRRWTLCLDADVLLCPGTVARLVAAAEGKLARTPLFGVSGTVADKLLGHVRAAGQHLYLTERIGAALRDGAFDARKRRPESHLKRLMGEAGHPWLNLDVPLGLHDFEQSYADIFRKVFVHTRKHVHFMPTARRAWGRQAAGDPDFAVALVSAALADAVGALEATPRGEDAVRIDRRAFPDDVAPILQPLGLVEKPPLAPDAWEGAAVAAALAAFADAPEYRRDRALIEAVRKDRSARMLARLRHQGVTAPLWFAGAALERTGTWLRRTSGDPEA